MHTPEIIDSLYQSWIYQTLLYSNAMYVSTNCHSDRNNIELL